MAIYDILPIKVLTGFWRTYKMILKLVRMNKHVKTARKILKSKRKEGNLALLYAIRKIHLLGEKGEGPLL